MLDKLQVWIAIVVTIMLLNKKEYADQKDLHIITKYENDSATYEYNVLYDDL